MKPILIIEQVYITGIQPCINPITQIEFFEYTIKYGETRVKSTIQESELYDDNIDYLPRTFFYEDETSATGHIDIVFTLFSHNKILGNKIRETILKHIEDEDN